MLRDAQGLAITTASEAAAHAFDHMVQGYLAYRVDAPLRLGKLLAADPGFAMAHCLKGYFALLAYNQAALPIAREALAAASALAPHATPREQAHVRALETWISGEPERAAAIWQTILDEHPRDILAFRLAHFVNFWAGRPDRMLASVLSVEEHWNAGIPGYGAILACRCFAHEECGYYTEAEAAGCAAIEFDPYDLWAAHGVAHVMEMQGRRREGITWIDSLSGNWEAANNLRHHLWWHAAMYHLELGDTARVLVLYDTGFRTPASALTLAQPDLYIDVQNAASMLWRLARHGVNAGDRWEELADHAEARIGDCLSAFTLPHWMMALAAAGRDAAATRMVAAMRDYAQAPSSHAKLVGDVALPVTQAVLAHGRGEHARAVMLMRPVLGTMNKLGGSHAQQDVLEQLYLDAAMHADLQDEARMILERLAGRHPLPPHRRIGYAHAAQRLGF